ncbi:MAG: AAA family ATPase [Acidobacteriia bacterium]|nr:AAA family ATPase [Terriglobia bacterium]
MLDSLTAGLIVGAKNLMQDLRASMSDTPVRLVMEQSEVGDWPAFLAKLDKQQPDVVIIELTLLADPLADAIRHIKATAGAPAVIIVHDSADPEIILKAIRSGADEYLYPPFKNDLRTALLRLSETRTRTRAGTRPRGKVFGFLGAKGGCGATTIACHLAVEIQRQTQLEVLLSDFDLDSGIVAFLMKTQSRYTLLDAVDNVHRLDLSFWKALVSNGFPGVEVITAPVGLAAFRDRNLNDFRDVLRFMRSNYDWTIADLGGRLSRLSLTVLEEMDELFLVTTLDVPALHQAKQVSRVLQEAGMRKEKLHLLINRMPKRNELGPEEMENMVGIPVYAAIPEDSAGIYDAYAEGTLLKRETHLGKHFARVAEKMTGIKKREKKKFSLF